MLACVVPGEEFSAAGGVAREAETGAKSPGVIFTITQQAFKSESPKSGEWAPTAILCRPG